MAPMTEAIKPAGCPGSYQPIARPRNPATKAPAMPSRMVIKQPPGSRPGIRNFAIAPTTKPITSVPRIAPINVSKFDSVAKGRNRFSGLQFNHLGATNIFTAADLLEQFFGGRAVEIQNRECSATSLISAKRHGSDVHAMFAQQGSDSTDHAGPVGIFEHKNDTGWPRFHRACIDANDSWSNSKECTAHRYL